MVTTVETGETAAVVEKLVAGGKGLVRIDGKVMLVDGGIPGERVIVRPRAKHRGVQHATVTTVLESADARVPPLCPRYGQCGGCQLQHLDYAAQLVHKEAMLRDALTRIGKLPESELAPIVPSPSPLGYRSHVRWRVFQQKGQFRLGFNEAHSHRGVETAVCPLISEAMRHIAQEVEERLAPYRTLPVNLTSVELRASPMGTALLNFEGEATSSRYGRQFLDLFQGIARVVGASLELEHSLVDSTRSRRWRWEEGKTALWFPFNGLSLRVSQRAFLQANWPVYEAIGQTLIQWIGEGERRRILELYAGSGALGLSLARRGALVTLVEPNPWALADARKSAAIGHIGRCRFRCASAETFLSSIASDEYDLVMVDPPRGGLAPHVRHELKRIRVPRLLYLSCDVATLARDIRDLRENGYDVARVQPFDMFPQTGHLETLVELTRTGHN
ncbi:MAG: class I SAM-dependent RNA methyltransferase [Nitrospirae bacterium]|nr:MAG: class I SAM-dependent RNA methyltransferase [Nitrospirota bacterium]